MPKLRPIDFNKIKDGNFDEAKRVVKDLLMLTPRGPEQNLRGHAYFKFDDSPGKEALLKTHQNYIEHFEKENARDYNFGWQNTAKASWWGYTNEQLYWTAKTLGAEGTWLGESDFRDILRTHFQDTYPYRGAKLTRGSRRLHKRFGQGWKDAIAGGKLGDLAFTCRVKTPDVPDGDAHRYYGPTTSCDMQISFAGRTKEEAKMMLTTMLGHAVEDVDVDFTAWQAAEPADILAKNVEQIARLAKARKKAHAQLAQIQQFIKNIDTLEEAVQMYSMTICE